MASFDRLLKSVRHRLRLAWAATTFVLWGPVVLIAGLALAVAARAWPLGWAEPAAIGVVSAAVLATVVAAVAIRISDRSTARAADRGLRTGDVMATALEVRSAPEGPFTSHVLSKAERVAASASPSAAIPVRVDVRRAVTSGLLLALVAGLLAAPNPQDEVRRQAAVQRALLDKEAGRLRKASQELAKVPGATEAQKEVAEELNELARALEKAPDATEGKKQVDAAAQALGEKLDPNLLAAKAAAGGLEKSLGTQPLPGTSGGDAAKQLQEAAKALESMTPEQRAAAADRLSSLAATQSAGNPKAAAELTRAASELRSGNSAAAAEAMRGAASAQKGAAGRVADQETAAGAVGALGAVRERLDSGAEGQQGEGQQGQQGQGQQGEGQQGEGQQGEGQQGQEQEGQQGQQGQGQGQQPGQGQGQGQQGQGQGQGQPSQAQGQGQGQSQTGGPGGQGQGFGGGPPSTAKIFDPLLSGNQEVQVQGQDSGQSSGERLDTTDGPTGRGTTQVPLSQALPSYRQEATRALDSLEISPSVRSLVRTYFDSLGQL